MTKNETKRLFGVPLFSEIDRENAARIFRTHGCDAVTVPDGEVILSPERVGDAKMGVLLSGRAAVTTPDPKTAALMRFLSPGEVFGIANLFSDTPYVSVIRAKGDTRVFFLPESAVAELLETDRNFLYRYLGFLSDRIRFLNRKIGFLTAGSAERRLALYLTSFGSSTVVPDASLSSLSDLLDIGRASLYRAFDRLTADGFLRKDGKTLILTDPEGMLNAYRS